MKILNLYSGLGGNRKLWGDDHEITAVELDETIAKFYSEHFPNDNVIVGNAHDYLLENYHKFDFIWSSPPCPSHSRARYWGSKPNKKVKPIYPDMKLYQEIIFLKHYFNGKWVIENVNPFYKPLVKPDAIIGRHLFWTNFQILQICFGDADINDGEKANMNGWKEFTGFDISGYKFSQRRNKIMRNCVNPKLGLHILKESQRDGLFSVDDYVNHIKKI